MNQIPDPRIANIVYNFLGNTLAQLNEIDKHNVGGSSLKALKTDPKNVFRVNADSSLNLIPNETPVLPPVQAAPPPVAPQATVVAVPDHNVVNAGINAIPAPTPQPRIELVVNNSSEIKAEFDKIISALTNIRNLLNEPIHN